MRTERRGASGATTSRTASPMAKSSGTIAPKVRILARAGRVQYSGLRKATESKSVALNQLSCEEKRLGHLAHLLFLPDSKVSVFVITVAPRCLARKAPGTYDVESMRDYRMIVHAEPSIVSIRSKLAKSAILDFA